MKKPKTLLVCISDASIRHFEVQQGANAAIVQAVAKDMEAVVRSGNLLVEMWLDPITLEEAQDMSDGFEQISKRYKLAESGWYAFIRDGNNTITDHFAFEIIET